MMYKLFIRAKLIKMRKVPEIIQRQIMKERLAKEMLMLEIARDRADFEARINKRKESRQPVAPSVAPWNSRDHICRLQVA